MLIYKVQNNTSKTLQFMTSNVTVNTNRTAFPDFSNMLQEIARIMGHF